MENINQVSSENKKSAFKNLIKLPKRINKRSLILLIIFAAIVIITNLFSQRTVNNRAQKKYNEIVKSYEDQLYYGSKDPSSTPTPSPKPLLIKDLGDGMTFIKSYKGKFSFVVPSRFKIDPAIDTKDRSLVYIKSPTEEYLYNAGGGGSNFPEEMYKVEVINGKALGIRF